MNHLLTARVLLSIFCVSQGLAKVAIDSNKTHATNPDWPGHARFHLVWQTCTDSLLAVIELYLLWMPAAISRNRIYVVALLAAVSPAGFLIAWITRRWFAGTLSDPNGIQPLRVTLFGHTRPIDMNLIAVLLAILVLAALVCMA